MNTWSFVQTSTKSIGIVDILTLSAEKSCCIKSNSEPAQAPKIHQADNYGVNLKKTVLQQCQLWKGLGLGRVWKATCQFTHLYPVNQDRRFCAASPRLHPSNLFKYSKKCLHRVAMVELSRQRRQTIMSKNNNVTTSFILVIFNKDLNVVLQIIMT